MELTQADVYTMVTLVDRTLKGDCEILFDGQRLGFPSGQYERGVPLFVAQWLFSASNGDKHKVWTTDGEFTCRFGVKDPPRSLIDYCGPHVAECDPIEVDATAVEGTDVKTTREGAVEVRRITVPRNELTEKQGAGRGAGALVGG